MEMRERLIEIIQANTSILPSQEQSINNIADALIAAGAMLPKFRVGQTVWCVETYLSGEKTNRKQKKRVTKYKIDEITLAKKDTIYQFTDWTMELERNIFATEAEARAALEGKE